MPKETLRRKEVWVWVLMYPLSALHRVPDYPSNVHPLKPTNQPSYGQQPRPLIFFLNTLPFFRLDWFLLTFWPRLQSLLFYILFRARSLPLRQFCTWLLTPRPQPWVHGTTAAHPDPVGSSQPGQSHLASTQGRATRLFGFDWTDEW